MDIIFPAKVENGRIKVIDHPKFVEYLRGLEGKIIELIAREPKKIRSNNQNSYMWGVVYKILSEYTGHTKDEIHDAMRRMFLANPNDILKIPRSTTTLSTKEMEEYLASIRQWAAGEPLNCSIPEPNEVNYEAPDEG